LSTATREWKWVMPRAWWTRRGHYFWYVVREFTSFPLALWLLWFLVEIRREQNGPAGYHPHGSIGFVIFSIVCLGFALYHSVTFLSLAGAILHFNVADKPIPSRLIVLSQFALWALASVLIGFALVYFAQ
jgi:succinate dehydrogenase subunit C